MRLPLRSPPRRVLIVRLSALGDCVHALPALDALRRGLPAGARIGWLVEDRAATLLEGHPQLDRVHVLPRAEVRARLRRGRLLGAWAGLRQVARELRAERYDCVIDLQCNLRSSLMALASGARLRVGLSRAFSKEASFLLRHANVTPARGKRAHKVERYLDVVAALGIDVRGARPVVPLPEAARERARGALAAAFPAGEPFAALHPGVSKFGAFKQWAPERYAAVADRLAPEGVRALVTWGPGERELAEDVVRRTQPSTRAVVAPETRSIQELAALYERAACVVGCDTGPVHLAAAVGARVVGLYGPKDPEVYAPWSARTGARADVVWKHVHCSPCTLRWCGNVICMDEIRPEDVEAAVRRALAAEDDATHAR